MKDLICECHDCGTLQVFASTTRTECYRRAWGEGWHFARGGIQICTLCWAPCQQGEPCADPEQCHDPKGCGHVPECPRSPHDSHHYVYVLVDDDFRCKHCNHVMPVVS